MLAAALCVARLGLRVRGEPRLGEAGMFGAESAYEWSAIHVAPTRDRGATWTPSSGARCPRW